MEGGGKRRGEGEGESLMSCFRNETVRTTYHVPQLNFTRAETESGKNRNFTYEATLENGAVLKVLVSKKEGKGVQRRKSRGEKKGWLEDLNLDDFDLKIDVRIQRTEHGSELREHEHDVQEQHPQAQHHSLQLAFPRPLQLPRRRHGR